LFPFSFSFSTFTFLFFLFGLERGVVVRLIEPSRETDERKMVPIPEGVERCEEEPKNEIYVGISQSDGGSSRSDVSSATDLSNLGEASKGVELKGDVGRVTLGSGEDEDELRG
jgi:hypothetical protein